MGMGMGGGGGGFMGQVNPLSSGRFNVPGTGGNMGMDLHRIPIVGNMFQNPYDLFKQQQMQNAAQAYSMYRPEAAQTAMNAMNSQSASMQPVNNALASMYGSGATQGFTAQNPFGPTAFTRGAAVGSNPYMPGQEPQPGPAATGSDNTQGAAATAWDMFKRYGSALAGGFGDAASSAGGGLVNAGQGAAGSVGTGVSAANDWVRDHQDNWNAGLWGGGRWW